MARPTAEMGEQSLGRIVARFERDGFAAQFVARAVDRIQCLACRKESDPRGVSMLAEERYEGTSAPDEQAVVLGLECPACKARGTLVLGFGTGAPVEEAEVFAALKDQRKRA